MCGSMTCVLPIENYPTSQAQHKHFNELLNSLEASSRQASHPTSPLRYHHSYLVDSFYSSRSNDKIRVTRDEKSGEVKEVVQKVRMGNLDIFSPKRFADWRVSVNLEIPGVSRTLQNNITSVM